MTRFSITDDGAMRIVHEAENLGIQYIRKHPFVCPYYNIKTHHCMELETFEASAWDDDIIIDLPGCCPHPFLATEDGQHLCMLELEDEFDWDKIVGRLKIHKGGTP